MNKRKAIEILFILAIIYSVLSINKVQVNQDITSYLPADSETRQGLSIMDEQFVTYGSAKVMLTNVTYNQADELVSELEDIDGVKQVTFDDSSDHYKGTDALFDITFDGTEDEDISKQALNDVKDTLSDYDVYVSTEVGSEEDSAGITVKGYEHYSCTGSNYYSSCVNAFNKGISANSSIAHNIWCCGNS